jgi:hypothetical protein
VELRINTEDRKAGIRAFKDQYPTARVETIDGEFIRGICACGTPIMYHESVPYNPEIGFQCDECRK